MARSKPHVLSSKSGKARTKGGSFLRGPLIRKLKWFEFKAKLTLYVEQVWPRLWPFLIIASAFITVVLFDLLSLLPGTVHFIVLLVFCGLGLGFLVRAFIQVSWPNRIEALHRLETDSGFEQRDLHVLLDRPVHNPNNKTAQSIWFAHVKQVFQKVANLRLRKPVSYLGERDRYSLRAVLIILLFLGVIEARNDYKERLERAFTPIGDLGVAQRWNVEIWVNPPENTGLRPLYLDIEAGQSVGQTPLVMAQHSELILRIDGIKHRQPVSVSLGSQTHKMNRMNARSYSLETTLETAQTITFLQNRKTLLSIPVDLRADLPPVISVADDPQKGMRGHLNLSFQAEDDYGLSLARLEIDAIERKGQETLVIEHHLSGTQKSSVFRGNFAEHPWAGQEVIMTPVVRDNADHQVFGKGIKTVLPVRHFEHALARKLVGLRKDLFEPHLSQIIQARHRLDRILENPQDFDHKVSVYLPLRVASDRLKPGADGAALAQVRTIFWETAVHLDEGNAGNARNQLEMMSRQMFDMMQQNATSSEMEHLFEQMRQSLEKYMQQMAQSMPKLEGFEQMLAPENMQTIGQDELQNLLDRAREMMRTGNMEAAQAMLNQFQSLLSRLAMQQPPNPGDAQKASEIMKQLQDVQQAQQQLLDQTFQRTRSSAGPSLEKTKQAAQEAKQQHGLSEQLQGTMQKMMEMQTQAPDQLQDALKAMKGAQNFLETGRDENAIQAQTKALEHLIDGMQQSANQMAQQLGMQSVSRQLPGYDPMGRGTGAPYEEGSGIELPTQRELNKSREVLQELYRRAGQKGRTDQELEYIERLLEPF